MKKKEVEKIVQKKMEEQVEELADVIKNYHNDPENLTKVLINMGFTVTEKQ